MYIITKNNVIQDIVDTITYLKQNTRNKLIVGTSDHATADYVQVLKTTTTGEEGTEDFAQEMESTLYPLKSGYNKPKHDVVEVETIPPEVTTDGTWVYVDGTFSQSEELVTQRDTEKFVEALPFLAMAELDERLAKLEGTE